LSLHSSEAPQDKDLLRPLFTCTNANQYASCTCNTRPRVSPHHVVNHSSQPGVTIHWSSNTPVLSVPVEVEEQPVAIEVEPVNPQLMAAKSQDPPPAALKPLSSRRHGSNSCLLLKQPPRRLFSRCHLLSWTSRVSLVPRPSP
jgi:hypothetical protein